MARCALHLTISAILFPRPIERCFWSDRASIIREHRRQSAARHSTKALSGVTRQKHGRIPFESAAQFFSWNKSNRSSPGLRSVIAGVWTESVSAGGNHCGTLCRNNQSPSELFLSLNGHIRCVKCPALCCNCLIQTYNCPIHCTNYNMLCLNSQ